jgi:hypothetical protein
MDMRVEIDRGDMTATEYGNVSKMLTEILRKGLPDVEVSSPSAPVGQGAKGDPVTIGTIVLTAFTSGGVVALINCFKSIYARDHAIKCSLALPNGTKLQIDAKNIGDLEVKKILTTALGAVEDQKAAAAPAAKPRAKPKSK